MFLLTPQGFGSFTGAAQGVQPEPASAHGSESAAQQTQGEMRRQIARAASLASAYRRFTLDSPGA